MPTEKEMLNMATCFQISEDLTIEKRGENKWCVKVFGFTVVNRNLERLGEPMPSNRTDEFIEATRFSLEEAFEIAQAYLAKIQEELSQYRIARNEK